MGEIAVPLWGAIMAVVEGPLGRCPAALFADQSKAFERIGHRWLREVLVGWGLPVWARGALLAMVELRSVVAPLAGSLGPERHLARSVGMGGP
eukprot:13237626-Alexandrium_andersonii.AAC.1